MYIVPGLVEGCSTIDSVLLSTLECFYSDSDCIKNITLYFIETLPNPLELLWRFLPDPLIYNSTLSRFPPNTLISTIVKEIMIERWNPSVSYNRFYNSCAPTHCSYSKGETADYLIRVD
jgi:hypothetical protein